MNIKNKIYLKSVLINNFNYKVILLIFFLLFIFNEKLFSAETINNNQKIIEVLTKQQLWSNRDAYDSSHVLMIPMHYSFMTNNKKNIESFNYLFENFNKNKIDLLELNLLDQVHWLYFLSNYLVLSGKNRFDTNYNLELFEYVLFFLKNQWLSNPRANWMHVIKKYNSSKMPKGSKEYLDFQMQNQNIFDKKYYGAATDHEMFLFAIAAEISEILKENNNLKIKKYDSYISIIEEIVEYGVNIILTQGSFEKNGKWIFQKAIWSDHPDFKYAGHHKLKNNLSEKKINDIAPDSSHAHRMPLFFTSLLKSPFTVLKKKELKKAFYGFCKSFHSNISFKNNMVLLKNFTDGRNGIYRYKYRTVGKNDQLGYGPYNLSSILFLGWYSFCPGSDYIFKFIYNMFPLKKEIVNFYTGPNTTRKRNFYYKWPEYFNSELSKSIIFSSIYISSTKN